METRIPNNIWPMAQIMIGLTADTVEEKLEMIEQLARNTGGTNWMHESYDAGTGWPLADVV